MSEKDTLLATALSKVIADYLEGHRHRSLSTLAKAAGVGYTTVRRLSQNEVIPNQETTLAIIDVVLSPKEKIAFLKTHYPKIGKMLEEAYGDTMGDDKTKAVSEDMLRYYWNLELHNFIFNIAATAAGTSFEQVRRLTGDKGVDATHEMIEHNILAMDREGKIQYANGTWAITNIGDALMQIRHSLGYFQKDLIGSDGAKLAHITASVNRQTLGKIAHLVRDFSIQLIKLKNDPSSKGNIPFYVDLIMNLYDKKPFLESA